MFLQASRKLFLSGDFQCARTQNLPSSARVGRDLTGATIRGDRGSLLGLSDQPLLPAAVAHIPLSDSAVARCTAAFDAE